MASKILPAHIIRLYAWDVLYNNTSMTLINGAVPIIPLEDEPQISDAQETYIIYGYSESNDPRLYEKRRGVVAFRIKARTFGELGQITNSLSRAFENCDISAAQINAWKAAYTGNIFKDIRFTSLETIYVEGGVADDEGGPLHGIVNVSYEAIINDPIFTLPTAAQDTLWA